MDHKNKSSLIECTLLDALNYRPLAPRLTRKTSKLRKYYHSFLLQLIFKGAPLLMLLLLPLFENRHSFSSSSDYQGRNDSLSKDSYKKYFWTSIIIETVLLLTVTIDAILVWIMLFPSHKSGRTISKLYKLDYYAAEFRLNILYIITLLITWPLLFASIGIYVKSGYTDQLILVNFFRFLLRPMFVIIQYELIREAIKAIIFTFLQLLNINILLILVIFQFAMIGLTIFRPNPTNNILNETNTTVDINEGNEYFSSFSQAYWNLLVFLTTSNSPDIITPAYIQHRAYFLYFGTYFFITHYFLLKFIIALYAIRFMSFLNKAMLKSYKNRLTNLCVAFALMAKENANNTKFEPENFFGSNTKIKTKDLKTYAIKVNLVNEEEFDDILRNWQVCNDLDTTDLLDWNSFRDLLLKIYECQETIHMLTCHSGVFYSTYLIIRVGVALTSLPLAIVHTIVLTWLIVKDSDSNFTNPNSEMTQVLLVFSCIFIPEFIGRVYLIIFEKIWLFQRKHTESCTNFMEWLFKGHHNRSSPELKELLAIIMYVLDLLVLAAIILLGFVHVSCLNNTSDNCGSNSFQLLQVNNALVLLRLLRMTTMNRMFAIVVHTLIHIVIVLAPFILLAYLLYYEFAVLGMTIFRNINFDDDAVTRCGSYENLYYYPYNFEDFSSSMVTLWNLMIVNNWHIITDAYVRGTTPAASIYFITWWLIMETVLNGVLYGVLLEIVLKAVNIAFQVSDEFKNSSMCRRAKLILEHYLSIEIDDSPFRFSLIHCWNIHGVINFTIEEEDKQKINNEVTKTTIQNNPDLVAKLKIHPHFFSL